MREAIDELARRETFKGYGPGTGYDFLRSAIAETDFRSRGAQIDDDEIFVSDGSKGDCGSILEILGSDNRIAITDPVYPVYVDSNVMWGHTGPARADGRYEGLVYLPGTPANGFVAEIPTQPVDLVYLCFPNNPTGSTIDRPRLSAWVEWARKHRAIILFDAAYEAYVRDPSLPRSIFEIPGARECAIEFRSFSKSGGFTGVRCAFIVIPKTLMGRKKDGTPQAIHPLWSRRHSTKFNGASYIVQRGAAALYTDEGKSQVRALIEHYMGNAALLVQACKEAGLNVFGGINAPYVWVGCPTGVTSWQMFDKMLNEANVVITPGAGFGSAGEGYFRISAFNTRANVEEVCRRIKALQ
jgi:LL-diaminopimelate aminotransferase